MVRSSPYLIVLWAAVGAGCNQEGTAVTVPTNPASSKEFAEGNAQLAIDLYRQLDDREGENFAFSPLSISSALAMTYAGARGQTAEQMAEALHFPADANRLHPAVAATSKRLARRDEGWGYELTVANRIWLQKGMQLEPAFRKTVEHYYGSGIADADFRTQSEPARQEINEWVANQTHDKIQDIIGPGVLDDETRLVLTNAVYLLAQWSEMFDPGSTNDKPFFLASGTEVKTPTMHQKERHSYFEDESVQVLGLSYLGTDLSMIVVLPRERNGLAAIEKKLSAKQVDQWAAGLKRREVQVALPRFKVEAEFELSKALAAMGMPVAFTRKADFSGMTKDEPLALSAVLHKTYVDVNEKGTEAAAATAVIAKAKAELPGSEPAVFRADHPFMFLIRDDQGTVLFIGRLVKPAEAK